MNRILKMGAVIILAFLSFSKMQAQATKTLGIDSINILDPIVIGGITNFEVRVRVTNLLAQPDSILGDIFYYYLTEYMDSLGSPPRIFLQGDTAEMVTDGMLDTISIDIQPNEIRTTPVNLIILWPAMLDSEPFDSICDSIYAFGDGYLGIPKLPENSKYNIIFPCPALQYVYIKPEELSFIRQINILSMDGKMLFQYSANEFSSGFVNIDELSNGNYLVELNYYNNKVIRTKILKR